MNKRIFPGIALSLGLLAITNLNALQRRGPIKRQRQPSGQMEAALNEHERIQTDFWNLQGSLGQPQASDAEIKRILKGRARGSKRYTQEQFNRVRAELNRLLSQKALDEQDIKTIQGKINQLKQMRPARWPRAADYQKLFDATKHPQ